MRRVAVVTGGASGMGRSICEQLALQGHSVAVLDQAGESAEELADQLRSRGAHAIGVGVDVADRRAVEEAYSRVRHELGPITILVTSAAVSGFVRFADITPELWERTIAVNLTGTFHCIQLAVPDMVTAGWGRIVTISSAAGQTGSKKQADYSASKGGVIQLTKTVALEYAHKGITANTVPPFIVDTPMMRAAQAHKHIAPDELLEQVIPARRLGTGEDVAGITAFLCSDAAGYITGQVIGVNGGAVT
jgi:NAD(P)-dependent dehydrogenase (short-subunit alcohol dehydrogenase family)